MIFFVKDEASLVKYGDQAAANYYAEQERVQSEKIRMSEEEGKQLQFRTQNKQEHKDREQPKQHEYHHERPKKDFQHKD